MWDDASSDATHVDRHRWPLGDPDRVCPERHERLCRDILRACFVWPKWPTSASIAVIVEPVLRDHSHLTLKSNGCNVLKLSNLR
jgi:hypothetical protein